MKLRGIFQYTCGEYYEEICRYCIPVDFPEASYKGMQLHALKIKYHGISQLNTVSFCPAFIQGDVNLSLIRYITVICTCSNAFIWCKRIPVCCTVFAVK